MKYLDIRHQKDQNALSRSNENKLKDKRYLWNFESGNEFRIKFTASHFQGF